jgi:hypothetical protein
LTVGVAIALTVIVGTMVWFADCVRIGPGVEGCMHALAGE